MCSKRTPGPIWIFWSARAAQAYPKTATSLRKSEMKVLITDYDFPDLELEQALYAAAGIEVVVAQCRSEADVIEASQGCQGLLVQYAPVNRKVFEARPDIRIDRKSTCMNSSQYCT